MTDLEQLETAAQTFVGHTPTALEYVKVHYDPDASAARVRFWRPGAIVEEAYLAAPELRDLARLIREKFDDSGSFELERAQVWTVRYGPCSYYGGSAGQLRELVQAEVNKLSRLPRDWKPMSREEIRQAMSDD